jgi:acyl carrier protein
MSPITAEVVRAIILDEIAPLLRLHSIQRDDVADDFDLRASGMVDSLGFLEIVATLESALGLELDFDDLDPASLTVVGPLSRWVAAQVSAAVGPAGAETGGDGPDLAATESR